MDSRLTLAGAVLFAAGALLLALLLVRVIRRISYRSDTSKKSPPKGLRLWQIIIALVLIVLGQGIFWLSSQLEYFRPLALDGTFAQIKIVRLSDPIKSLQINYVPLSNDSAGVPNKFYLSGDSWRFNGEIIDFKFARKYLRLPEHSYKVVKFESRFMNRPPQHVSGAMLNENLLESGPSQAFQLFRDCRYFKWFATVDSFATDYVTTDTTDHFALKLEADGTVGMEQ
jgi:hypothetical protein